MGVKAFKFKLQSVLDLRLRELEKIQNQFAVQQHRVFDLKRLLREIQDQLRIHLVPKPEEQIEPILSQQRFAYTQYLKNQIEHVQGNIRKEEIQLERLREQMRQAHVKKRSLELLEEKQRTAYIKDIEYKESNEIEDIVVARMARG